MLLDTRKIEGKTQAAFKMVGADIGFERTRRITGYLVGTLDRFNNAKRAEERDRVRHGV
jgi:anaerobic ribonucleoside-triphosphate reductase